MRSSASLANDYPTADGTGIRDYIHVMNLAEGHVAALHRLEHGSDGVTFMINLGTSIGLSVLDVVNAFQTTNEMMIPNEFAPRRPGDIAAFYASGA